MPDTKMSLTSAELQFFEQNGYVGPFTLLDSAEAEQVWNQTRLDLLDTSTAPYSGSRLNYDRHLDIPTLGELTSSPEIVDRMASIFGDDVLLWRTEWFPKYPGDEGTDWHQAERFIEFEGDAKLVPTQRDNPTMELTAWIAFTDSTRENGCMRVMPRTHRTWFFDETRNIPFEPDQINQKLSAGARSGFYGYNWDRLKLDPDWVPDDNMGVDMELKAGQFFIFTSRCMHGAYPNTTSDQVRFGWATRYVPTHVKVYPDIESFDHFGEHLSLDNYATVLVSGTDNFGHNSVRKPLRRA